MNAFTAFPIQNGISLNVPSRLKFRCTETGHTHFWKLRTRTNCKDGTPFVQNGRPVWDAEHSIHHSICYIPPYKDAPKGKWVIANLLSPVADGEIPNGIVHKTYNGTPLSSEGDFTDSYVPPFGVWSRYSTTGIANSTPEVLEPVIA